MPTANNTPSPTSRTFAKNVMVPRRDQEQNIVLGPDGNPIVERTLGKFVFRRPTVMDLRDIGIRRSQALMGAPPADTQTAVLVEVFAAMPYQVAEAPKGWNWQEQYDPWDMVAIYQAYMEGIQAYTSTSGSGSTVKAAADEESKPTGIGDPGDASE